MHQAEFQVGHLLDGLLGALHLRMRKAGQLDQDPVHALRLNDRFGHAEFVHAFAQHLDRLRQRGRIDLRVRRLVRIARGAAQPVRQLNGDRNATLQVQPEFDPARRLALQPVQNVSRRMRLVLRLEKREIPVQIIRADGFLDVFVALVGP